MIKTLQFLILLIICISCHQHDSRQVDTLSDNDTINSQIDNINNRVIEKISKTKIDSFLTEYSKIKFDQYISPINSDNFVIYHEWTPTASEPILTRWDINLNDSVNYYIKETYNNKNQVIEMIFMKNGEIFDKFTAFHAPIIKFKYQKNKITEILYSSDHKPFYGFEAGIPTMIDYFINDSLQIDSVNSYIYLPPNMYEYFDSLTVYKGILELTGDYNPTIIYDMFYSKIRLQGQIPRSSQFNDKMIHKPYRLKE